MVVAIVSGKAEGSLSSLSKREVYTVNGKGSLL